MHGITSENASFTNELLEVYYVDTCARGRQVDPMGIERFSR